MSSSASVLIVIASLLAVGYVAAGVLTAIVHDMITDTGTDGWEDVSRIVFGWPIAVFVALTVLYGMWATQRELDNLGGLR